MTVFHLPPKLHMRICAIFSIIWFGFGLPVRAAEAPAVVMAIERVDRDLVGPSHPDMGGIKYGAEGGEIVRDRRGVLHWFTSEQTADPYWLVNRIAHWTSKDGRNWGRDPRWVKQASADNSGLDDRSSYFDPQVAYDDKDGYWYLFYIGWRNSSELSYHQARAFRARSAVKGPDGIGGPYHDRDSQDVPVLEPSDNPAPYEASWAGRKGKGYGVATVTVFPAKGRWIMIWTENMLAEAASPGGAFKRLPEGSDNPLTFGRAAFAWKGGDHRSQKHDGPFYFENPIVARLPKGRPGGGLYLMVAGLYNDETLGVVDPTCGYATSRDGLHWSEFRPLMPGFGQCFTLLSILPEADGTTSLYMTDRTIPGMPSFESLSRISVRIEERTH